MLNPAIVLDDAEVMELAPSVPAAPVAPAVADAPPVIDPLASTGGKPVTVAVQTTDAGQDVADRRIGHVVIGGIS